MPIGSIGIRVFSSSTPSTTSITSTTNTTTTPSTTSTSVLLLMTRAGLYFFDINENKFFREYYYPKKENYRCMAICGHEKNIIAVGNTFGISFFTYNQFRSTKGTKSTWNPIPLSHVYDEIGCLECR